MRERANGHGQRANAALRGEGGHGSGSHALEEAHRAKMPHPGHECRLDAKELDCQDHVGNGQHAKQRHELGDVGAANGAANERHHGVRREPNNPAYGLAQDLVAGVDERLERPHVDLLAILAL